MLFSILAIFLLISCDTECGQKKTNSEPDKKTTSTTIPEYSFYNHEFSSTARMLDAETDATDDTEFYVAINNRAVSAKSKQGKLLFNMGGCWSAASKGGKAYPARVSVSGNAKIKGSADLSLEYWPVVEMTLHCPEEMIIYNGSKETFQPPSFSVNYESKDYEFEMSFKITDTDGSTDITDSVGTENWKMNDMLDYLSNTNNDGRSVTVIASVTPVRDGVKMNVLTCIRSVIYHCRRDVLVSSVELEKYHDHYAAVTYDADHNSAGGNIVYDWQIADAENAMNKTIRTNIKVSTIIKSAIARGSVIGSENMDIIASHTILAVFFGDFFSSFSSICFLVQLAINSLATCLGVPIFPVTSSVSSNPESSRNSV